MASVEKITQANTAESEMEEGEIVDELDDLSDVSSEEEFLLRQRLEVLEDYNNALERTKKKRTSGMIKPIQDYSYDRSKISADDIDEIKLKSSFHSAKDIKHVKQYSKLRRRKEPDHKYIDDAYSKRKRDNRKKSNHTRNKPKLKIIRESSDESEDEYRYKRRKLADAVVGYRCKTDTSSLSARLKKMLHQSEEPIETDFINMYQNNNNTTNSLKIQFTPPIRDSVDKVDCGKSKQIPPKIDKEKNIFEPIDLLSSDDDVKVITNDNEQSTLIENGIAESNPTKPEPLHEVESDSDEDLAELRQQVLSTKTLKGKPREAEPETKEPSEADDITELRLICLKSTLLKRAIEFKQKQKLQKRRSQSTLEEDLFNDEIFFPSKIDSGNNTDIESMDMDIGSDADEKNKDGKDESVRLKKTEADIRHNENNRSSVINVTNKEEELEEDEDLLRAKLLTSLSKNLPNLVSPELLNTIDKMKVDKTTVKDTKVANIPEEKRFIIKLDETDSSEGEHEATKNLTKMHMKLSEQTDFQQQLDLFLKSTRMQVENAKLPDVVQKQATPKKPEKFVAKAVNHLPKSEQIEYKNLVRRMAELVKMKQLRQTSINSATQPLKETQKPINTTIDTNLEERISLSRKKIADESAKMLKLKEEATKLSQRYKIVSTELHNISTAITLNKKQQRSVNNCLSKIRHQHQTLIKSSSTSLHSKVNGHFNSFSSNATATKLQKENTPKDEYKNVIAQKTVKISIANDFNKNENNTTNPRLCVEVNIANNKKIIKMPSPVMEKRLVEITELENEITDITNTLAKESCNIIKTGGENTQEIKNVCESLVNDYKSPLDALGETSWKSDPNAILCPFDVGGQCKDSDCKYLHTLSQQ